MVDKDYKVVASLENLILKARGAFPLFKRQDFQTATSRFLAFMASLH